MRKDDFDRRPTAPRGTEFEVEHPRVPGKQTRVEAELGAALGQPTVPGKRTLVEEHDAHARTAANEVDPASEAEFHVRKARELMAKLAAHHSPAEWRVIRADLHCHLGYARTAAARAASRRDGGKIFGTVMQLHLDAQSFVDPKRTATTTVAAHGPGRADGAAAGAVQRKAVAGVAVDPETVGDVAAHGTQNADAPLPHLAEIQRSFGQHDVSNVRAQIGGHAATSAAALGAHAYAHGGAVAFAQDPDLRTTAHEAAHVVQQRAGVAPTGLDGGASDSLERHADAVADAVVAGHSAEELLGAPSGNANSSTAVQRKSVPGAAIDGETKYTFRISRGTAIKIAGIPAKLTRNFEFTVKDKGSLHASAGGLKGAALSTQRLVEQSSDGLDAKIKGSLVKGSFDLLTAGQLPSPLSELPLSVRAEVTGLDAGLSLKKMDLKLMTAAVVIEGNFTAWMPKDVQAHLDVKASLRLEFQLDPKLAKDIVELAKATDDVERGVELDVKIAKTEKKLAELKELASSKSTVDLETIGPGTYRNKLAAKEAARMSAPAEIREAEKELSKLKRLKEPVDELRKKALAQIEKIGARLEERAGGRLLKKFAGKAFALVFEKFLPIYNTLSTIKDIYDAGTFLASLNWDDIGKKIADGGDGGSSLEDGTHHEGPEGVGGNGDDGQLPDADAIQADLDRREHVVLHPAAQAIVDSVEAKGANARPGAKGLSASDQESINAIVPEDLTPDEIKEMSMQLNASGTDPQDTVEAVIAAVQRIRPFGEKRAAANTQDQATPNAEAKAAAVPPKRPAAHTTKRTGATSQVVDLEPALSRVITVDPATGKADYPSFLTVQGTTFAIQSVQTAFFGTEDSGFLVKAQVLVTRTSAQEQLRFRDGTPVAKDVVQTVVYGTGADLTVKASE